MEALVRTKCGLMKLNNCTKKDWEEANNLLCIDRSKVRDQCENCICSESKNTCFEFTLETEPFQKKWF